MLKLTEGHLMPDKSYKHVVFYLDFKEFILFVNYIFGKILTFIALI